MHARVGTVMGFPKVKRWVVTLVLPHETVRLGQIDRTEEGKYECTNNSLSISHGTHYTLIDAAYRIVWVMADNNVHIYFSYATVKWCMEHDEIEDSEYTGIKNV